MCPEHAVRTWGDKSQLAGQCAPYRPPCEVAVPEEEHSTQTADSARSRHVGDLCSWMDVGLAACLLLFAAVIGKLSADSCSGEQLERCLAVLLTVIQSEDLAHATTRHKLQLVCSKLQQGVKCVDDHTSRCFNQAQQRLYDSVVSESRQVIEDLCVEGEMQEDYLKYAPCFKNISTDVKKCATKYNKQMAVLTQNVNGEESRETGLKEVCCALTDFSNCKHEHAQRDCGPGASQFLQRYMDRMSGSLLNEHCVVYTYGSDSCSSSKASRFHFTEWAAIVVSLYITQQLAVRHTAFV